MSDPQTRAGAHLSPWLAGESPRLLWAEGGGPAPSVSEQAAELTRGPAGLNPRLSPSVCEMQMVTGTVQGQRDRARCTQASSEARHSGHNGAHNAQCQGQCRTPSTEPPSLHPLPRPWCRAAWAWASEAGATILLRTGLRKGWQVSRAGFDARAHSASACVCFVSTNLSRGVGILWRCLFLGI